jgi:hypothetical protein
MRINQKPTLQELQDVITRLQKETCNQVLVDAIYDALGDDGIVICAHCGVLTKEYSAAICSDCYEAERSPRELWEEWQADAKWQEVICSDQEQ